MRYRIRWKFSVLFVIVSVGFVKLVESSKYSSKELEELRKFYYDDPDYDYEEHESKKGSRYSAQGRSSAKGHSKKTKPSESEENNKSNQSDNDEVSIGPGEFIKDAKKYLDAGRKTIDRGAQRILPRIRIIRSGLFKFELNANAEDDGDDNDNTKLKDESRKVHKVRRTVTSDEEEDELRQAKRNKDKDKQEEEDRPGPMRRFQTRVEEAAAETGGTFFSILNKMTPPPSLGLPTPFPNFEDFGG